MDAGTRAEVERVLGGRLDDSYRGTCDDLNALPPGLLAAARRLPPLLGHAYLAHYLTDEMVPALPLFMDEVVWGSADPTTWRRGGYLVPAFPLEELLTLDVHAILGVLGPRPNDRWYQITPDAEAWEQTGSEFPGAPALARPELTYRWRLGPRVVDVRLGLDEVAPVGDIRVATRRWVASRFASRVALLDLAGVGTATACAGAIIGSTEPSRDALIAIGGFLRECAEGRDDPARMPGFRGPDAWYTGE